MSPRDVRALVIGTALVAGAWLALRGVPRALAMLYALETKMEQEALLLERAQRETSSLRALSDSIATLEEIAGRTARVLLVGEDQRTAGFDLTRRATLVMSESAAWVASTDLVPDSVTSGPLARVTVRSTLETDVRGLAGIVRNLELDSALSLEAVLVEAEDPNALRDQIERLQVRLSISGWFRAREGADSSARVGNRQ